MEMYDSARPEEPLKPTLPEHPRSAKDGRLSSQRERERLADAAVARPFRQALWNARRVAVEILRPALRRVFSPLIPHSRLLQKKLQRPAPAQISYNKSNSELKPLVLHFLANFEIGGTPKLVCDIIENTSDKYRHIIISKHIARPPPYQGVDLVDMAFPLRNSRLRDFLSEHGPRIIHVHYWNGMTQDFNWYHSVFKVIRSSGIPILENVNTSGEPYFDDSVKRYVFCSDWSRRASGADWISEQVIYPGTRFEDFIRPNINSVSDTNIGMVYRLGGDKIGRNAIEIFINVSKILPNVKSVIVGDGDLVDYFKSRVNKEGLDSRIIFTGWISYEELKNIYRDLSIFIAPVKDDTFGSVSVYAMCSGIPVVGFGVGGIPEIVSSGDLLAAPGDVDGLTNIVVNLLGDRDRRLLVGAENQRRARALFSVEAMTNAFSELYASLME